MKKLINILILSLLLSMTCFAQDRTEPKIISRTSVRQHPYYAPYVLDALKELVAERGKSKRNTFYVSRVYDYGDSYHSVLVYWKENHALILWEPGRGVNQQGNPDPRYDLRDSRRYWELDKVIVPSLNAVGGSSFLITKKDARKWVQDCVRYGARYVVNR